jgi:hypothetical protein
MTKVLSVIVTLILCVGYIYLRFLRERLPKDIPFELTVLGFFILINICCVYLLIIKNLLIKPKEDNTIVFFLMNKLYKPLNDLDDLIKTFIKQLHIYKKIFMPIMKKCKPLLYSNNMYIILFEIFPRLVLMTALVIDTYYFHKLFYIYKVLLLGILILLGKYIIYSLRKIKEEYIQKLSFCISKVDMTYIEGVFPEDDDEDDDVSLTMIVDFNIFLELQTIYSLYKDPLWYDFFISTEYYNILKKELKMKPEERFLKVHFDYIENKLESKIKPLLELSIFIEICSRLAIISNATKNIKKIKLLIFINYLLCWLNILLLSLQTLNMELVLSCINSTWINNAEPFSNIVLFK